LGGRIRGRAILFSNASDQAAWGGARRNQDGLLIEDGSDCIPKFILCGDFLGISDAELVIDSSTVPQHTVAIEHADFGRPGGAQSIRDLLVGILKEGASPLETPSMSRHLAERILDVGIDGYQADALILELSLQFDQAMGVLFG
jgi:hypothetical protein